MRKNIVVDSRFQLCSGVKINLFCPCILCQEFIDGIWVDWYSILKTKTGR